MPSSPGAVTSPNPFCRYETLVGKRSVHAGSGRCKWQRVEPRFQAIAIAAPRVALSRAKQGSPDNAVLGAVGYARRMDAGPYIQTVSGRRFNPLNPDPAEIDIADIARALSNQCRFGGNCRCFYSVANHSCLVADLLAERGGDVEAQLWALLHDASEAYLVDLPHPLKHRSELGRLYAEAEDTLQAAICQRFQLPLAPPALLKEVDRALLATERRAVAQIAWEWPELNGVEPLDLEIDPWLPERAYDEFLARYRRVIAARDAAS
jgi:hypothetical protein